MASQRTSSNQNRSGRNQSEGSDRRQTVLTPKSDAPEPPWKQFKPCEEEDCGEGSEATMHCAHCGHTLCQKHRAEHIKGVIDELKNMRQMTADRLKKGKDRRGKIMRELKFVEHSRARAKAQVVNNFRGHKLALEEQKKSLNSQLAGFAKPKLKGLKDDSNVVEKCIKELKITESSFNGRLRNYNPMSDPDFSNLCQDLINYSNQVNWLKELIAKPDKVKPLVYEPDSSLSEVISGFGKIVFQSEKEKQSENDEEAGQNGSIEDENEHNNE
ncbi:uncharacterized protein LOC134848180 isoform X2 [Symsagittifera roscoffensis]|uniref:uncharacterized protein LOC134848180 isoform X2 n=1 Tax=Symsagittifera roscoffensis TaxID=84072 RepID=UPI00307BAB95